MRERLCRVRWSRKWHWTWRRGFTATNWHMYFDFCDWL